MIACIVSVFDWHVKIKDDCSEEFWLLVYFSLIKLVELNHVLLNYLDGFIAVQGLDYFYVLMLLKEHLHGGENEWLVIDK